MLYCEPLYEPWRRRPIYDPPHSPPVAASERWHLSDLSGLGAQDLAILVSWPWDRFGWSTETDPLLSSVPPFSSCEFPDRTQGNNKGQPKKRQVIEVCNKERRQYRQGRNKETAITGKKTCCISRCYSLSRVSPGHAARSLESSYARSDSCRPHGHMATLAAPG